MISEVSKNQRAWENLFEKYRILQKIEQYGFFEITATQINEFREARLMTKFDHRVNLPELWSNNIRKLVKLIFMTYSNSIFSLYEYCFENINDYNSLVLIKQKNYSFESVEINLSDIIGILNRVRIVEEPAISFPQADSFILISF